METVTLGIDLAKNIFAVHCMASAATAKGCCSVRR